MATKLSRTELMLTCFCWLALCGTGQAADINGAWANNLDVCQKIYQKKGGSISFAPDADLYGSGIIIEGNRIRGKAAVCNIKLRKDEGALVNIAATCSTDVAVETMHFVIKIINESKIARTFPGLPELDTAYERCPP